MKLSFDKLVSGKEPQKINSRSIILAHELVQLSFISVEWQVKGKSHSENGFTRT